MMIAAGGQEEETAAERFNIMALVPERSRSFHNFSFNLKWGRQKQLRCVKDSDAADESAGHYFSGAGTNRRSASVEDGGGGRAPSTEARPWNLRIRRAICKDPRNPRIGVGDRQQSFFPASRPYSDDGCGKKSPRAKFSICLSKQEIQEDFLAMVGTRPARRPKKRSKYAQKQIDGLFPGSWLSEITADMYKVNEHPEVGTETDTRVRLSRINNGRISWLLVQGSW